MVQESKGKPVAPKRSIYREECGWRKCLIRMVSASRVVASGWIEGSMVVSVAGQKLSLIKGVLTYVIARHRRTLVREVGERKESIKLINDNLEQNNRRGGGSHNPALLHGKTTTCRVH